MPREELKCVARALLLVTGWLSASFNETMNAPRHSLVYLLGFLVALLLYFLGSWGVCEAHTFWCNWWNSNKDQAHPALGIDLRFHHASCPANLNIFRASTDDPLFFFFFFIMYWMNAGERVWSWCFEGRVHQAGRPGAFDTPADMPIFIYRSYRPWKLIERYISRNNP